MRFINDDISLVHDKREVPCSYSKIGLVHKMESLAMQLGCSHQESSQWLQDADIIAGKIIKTIMRNDPTICGDNIYGVVAENFMCNFYNQSSNDIGHASDLIGLHEFDHGLTFYGFVAGGDGQRSVFMIIYDDGSHLRLYTPRLGNKLNLHRQEPLMSDNRSEKYMAKYELDNTTLGFNWNAMKIDILANVQVDYTDVMRSHLRTIKKEEK